MVVATGAAICDKALTRRQNRVETKLFNATKQNISLHINKIYDEGELEQIATVWYKKKNREISWKLKKTSYLCTVDQNKQHLSDKRRK